MVPESLSACSWRLEFFKFCGGRYDGSQSSAVVAGSRAGRCGGGHGCQGVEVEGGGLSWEKKCDILWWIDSNQLYRYSIILTIRYVRCVIDLVK